MSIQTSCLDSRSKCQTCNRKEESQEKSGKLHLKKCGKCRKVYYCSKSCQKKDWRAHKVDCQSPTTYMSMPEPLREKILSFLDFQDVISVGPLVCKNFVPRVAVEDVSKCYAVSNYAIGGGGRAKSESIGKLTRAVRSYPDIENLSLSIWPEFGQQTTTDLLSLKHLKRLSITKSWGGFAVNGEMVWTINTGIVPAIIDKNPKLIELDLSWNPITDETSEHISKLDNLEKLLITGCYHISRGALSQLVSHKNLRELGLGSLEELRDSHLEIIGAKHSMLEKLNLSQSKKISNEGLLQLASLPHLKELNLMHCKRLTIEGIKEFMQVSRSKPRIFSNLIEEEFK